MKVLKPTCSLCSQSIPDVTVEVIVTGQKKTTALAEGDTGDAADDVVVAVHGQLLVGPDVEHSAGRVITSRCKSISVREKLLILKIINNIYKNLDSTNHYGVDITLMSCKCL